MCTTFGYTLSDWQRQYQHSPQSVRETLHTHLASLDKQDNAWISLATTEQLEKQLADLLARAPSPSLPLWGVPFAVKDNIDVAGWPTSAACPAASYCATQDAEVVRRLKAAGAILMGKTNLDQFATGLVGTRSPFGAVSNSFDTRYISGGSSSGSASVLARGFVAFSLGTDTAGSGRVPAGFNNIVGLKPTKGWLSSRGVVPACRLNDTVSLFALTVTDAYQLATLCGGYDPQEPYSRSSPREEVAQFTHQPHFAIPDCVEFFGDTLAEAAWHKALAALKSAGVNLSIIDFTPFQQLAEQLYAGPWVAERSAVVDELLNHPDKLDPVVYRVIQQGRDYSAIDAYRAEYLRASLSRQIAQALQPFEALVVPTAPTIHTLEAVAEDPITRNAQLGIYTNFTNLADLCALALPAPFRDDGLPAGITLLATAWHDRALAEFGERWQHLLALPLGATGKAFPKSPTPLPMSTHHVRVAVVGAHLRGMPLNYQLTTRGAAFIEQTQTADNYRLFALLEGAIKKPGLLRSETGQAITVELWDIPLARFGEFVAEIPAPLGIGSVSLQDGRTVKGFICEPTALTNALEITEFGGWRYWLSQQQETENV